MIIVSDNVKIFSDNIDSETMKQIYLLAFSTPYKNSKIRIMPDCHAGTGCVIGTTMLIDNKITPNLVGVDIGCGIITSKFKKQEIDFVKLDNFIRSNIPHGFNVNQHSSEFTEINNLKSKLTDKIIDRALKSLGTLGGGNHFIEIDKDDEGYYYLLIHTGSRNLGKEIAIYFQNVAINHLKELNNVIRANYIKQLKLNGKENEIQNHLKEAPLIKIDKDLAYLEDTIFNDYLNDMAIAQKFAKINRETITRKILNFLQPELVETFDTIHNYIDIERKILRKGAISAQNGEKVIIPMNMRDGAFVCIGKGNEDWNYSAPHGAGRISSRSEAKRTVNMDKFRKSMEGIFTTCVNKDTLDESPFAYKSSSEIELYINDTVEIKNKIKPIYNFKSS